VTTDPQDTGPAILLAGVVKRFGALTAVDELDLDVTYGTVLGLLGPNGAGKSTTMRLLTGQTEPDAGTIDVLGQPVPERSKQARLRMGVVPQQDNLDTELTVRQNLDVFAALYRIPRRRRRRAVDEALALAGLTDRGDAKVTELSGGMRRRLLIARGLVHSPDLVLLDEPTVGLDPQVRQELWSLIDRLRTEGVTILMSTHYIEEAERLADDVAVMSHGRVVARGAPRALLAEHAGAEALEFFGASDGLWRVESLARAAGLPTRRTGPSLSVLRAESAPEALVESLGPASRRAATLEDVFVLLTGERLE
jgi:lipooligosaccharide transport system ATP-binding protein